MSGRRRRQRGEEGSALVLALVFITVIGLLISAVLTFVDVSFRYTRVVRTGRGELYAADGAVEAAIARMNADGVCGDFHTGDINDVPVDVTCEPAPRPKPPPPEPAPSPPKAILTLGPGGLHEFADSGPVKVRGNVFSHSTVLNSSSSALSVQGDVMAVRACTGDIRVFPSTQSKQCDLGANIPALAKDPDYPPDLAALPPRKVAPDCPPATWLVTLEPGYYDDATKLSALTSGGLCAGRVVWLQPGVYYFDFNFTSTVSGACDITPGLCTWQIDDATANVVGGAPLKWSADNPGPLSSRPTIDVPGGCSGEQAGVQLVFGGQSRMAQSAGKVELCPRSGGAVTPINVYGLKQGSAPSQRKVSLSPATARNTGSVDFLTPNNAKAVEGGPAPLTTDVAFPSLVPGATAALQLKGFDAIPEGSRVVSAALRVVHRETGDVGPLKATITASVSPAPTSVDVLRCPGTTDYCPQGIDLLGLIPAKELSTKDVMSSLTVTYEARPAEGLAKVGTESLDGIVADIVYTPPGLQPLSGCLTGPTPCPLLKVTGDQSRLAIGGTAYAPTASVDLDLKGVAAPVLSRGIITSSLSLKVASIAGYLGPVVALPNVHPDQAVLTLRQQPGEGLVQTTGSGRSLIRGDVFSQADVRNDSGTAPLAIEGRLAAVGACTGLIDVLPPPDPPSKACAGDVPEPIVPDDPIYPPAIEAVPARQTVPPCPPGPTSWLVTLSPGYYDDAAALSALTGGGCPNKVVRLKTGTYYFDFNFAAGGCAADACTWKLNDPTVSVVGGEPRGWDEGAAARPVVDIPGGCRTDATGVQLIFGGESRLQQGAGNLELCPLLGSHLAPAIALYGLSRGTATETANSYSPSRNTSLGFSNPTNAYEIDESPRRTADATALAATSASITLEGFVANVPAGSRFNSATLRVAHREGAVGGSQTITAVTDAGALLPPTTVASTTSFVEQAIALPGITSAAQLAGLKVTYQVTLTALTNPKEELDGIELLVKYTPPTLRALTGCLVDVSSPCALVQTLGGQSKVVVNGTVYAPTAALDFNVERLSSPIVNDGIITGTLRLHVAPTACYAGPAVTQLDAQTPAAEPGVVFTACIRGTPVLRARATFPDAKVQSWSVLR